jgi:hypothetical protein
LVVAEGALVADAHQCGRPNIAVAYRTFSIAFVAEATDGNTGLLAAHDKVAGSNVSGTIVLYLEIGRLTDDGET